jgi:Cys-rich repeat protein
MTSSSARPRIAGRPFVCFLAIPLFLAGLVCCGGSTTVANGDGGAPGRDGGTADGSGSCPIKLSGTAAGRPVAATCPASTNLPPPNGDAGPTSCTTDADCASDSFYHWCRGGKCEPDQCFIDNDCASGQACVCANEQPGNALHTNACVTTQCRVDSDCGAGEVCSPTVQDLCSGGGPFFACRSSADQCRVDADCCASAPSCRYQSTVGHWECVPRCTIAG